MKTLHGRSHKLLFLVLTSVVLVACGDDSSSSPTGKMAEYATLEDAGECTPSRYGETVYVSNPSAFYFCGGKRWVFIDEDDETHSSDNGSSRSEGSSSSEDGLGPCTEENFGEYKLKEASNRENVDTIFCCTTIGWIDAHAWSWDIPKEVRQNPRSDYGSMTDRRDGQIYKTIVIGSQTWMAENLNYDYRIDGVSYGNWCYGDSARYCSVTGRLYTWGAAMDTAATGCGDGIDCAADTGMVRGVCPDDWHLPSRAEWDTLFAAVGGGPSELKSQTGWRTNWRLDGYGNDAFGFSALASGWRKLDGDIVGAGGYANFWSSSEKAPTHAYLTSLSYDRQGIDRNNLEKAYGYSVRCVKD
ncbi:MAG: fibrobacter succinogenes major paralogous domain-containing protein [Fibrobacterales bacterium]|nr:fibrobacter succinogenes major paralogous domain-containing protein [Fibrobacterales bacterium]